MSFKLTSIKVIGVVSLLLVLASVSSLNEATGASKKSKEEKARKKAEELIREEKGTETREKAEELIQRKEGEKAVQERAKKLVQKKVKAEKQVKPGFYYKVKKGDTLGKIAGYKKIYGDSNKWILIYKANKDKIKNPNAIRLGQILYIPRN